MRASEQISRGATADRPPVRLMPLRASRSKRPTLGFTNSSLNPSCSLPSFNGWIIRALDSLRGYCYRGVLIVVRQDFRTPRPTGWVQINFLVSNVAALQGELEQAYRASSVYQLSEEDRAKIVRFRLKPDVMRGDRQVIRLEVAGPEGFMIGFDQDK